ncbi:M23 family metallopeptidase [Flavobacterium litorale]|uniref:M23 family metallopeptidase n=1 Tax=Flavobacterium litorale TaxID=2856519 RepID=A0ABX8VAJ1_9FLAO|nr:M23 family metallopeptidase [Flavobacterium litorale]QYJ68218.1 M23 family metallopeptidase [Flavobacterium litorale]
MVSRLFFLLFTLISFAQQQYPEDYFKPPLDLPVCPSGTFGEVRSNHFHAGLDYRTQKRTGFPVHAAADGYVSRIKVSTYGYGTALYITHPNGYTTVYAHLESYAPKIDDVVRAEQYRRKLFQVEMFFKPNEIPVQQGETVAISGNTGSSGGPHLHFEYRDTETQKIINPLHFGLKKLMTDTQAPRIKGLMVYPLNDDAVVNGSNVPVTIPVVLQKDGTYRANAVMAKGTVGLSINASDRSTGSTNNNGVYKVQLFRNDTLDFNYTFDTFAFSETRYANNFIDYAYYHKKRQRFHKLFTQTPYPLSVVSGNTSNGQFEVLPNNTPHNFTIEVADFHGNKTTVHGTIVHTATDAKTNKKEKNTPYFVAAAKDNTYSKDGVTVHIPSGTFYEDFYMDFEVNDSVLYLHNPTVPVHKNITLSFDVSHLSPEVLQKTFISGFSEKRRSYHTSHLENGKLTAKVKALGNYKLDQDTIAPKIYTPSFKEGSWISKQQTFSLKISDNFAGIATFDAWLNNKWVLLHYEHKTNTVFHNFSDGIVANGRNDLKVVVTDNVGNSTTYNTHFFRTQNTNAVENDK